MNRRDFIPAALGIVAGAGAAEAAKIPSKNVIPTVRYGHSEIVNLDELLTNAVVMVDPGDFKFHYNEQKELIVKRVPPFCNRTVAISKVWMDSPQRNYVTRIENGIENNGHSFFWTGDAELVMAAIIQGCTDYSMPSICIYIRPTDKSLVMPDAKYGEKYLKLKDELSQAALAKMKPQLEDIPVEGGTITFNHQTKTAVFCPESPKK